MDTYLFVLGRNAELSVEELCLVLEPLGHISDVNRAFLVFHGDIDPRALLKRLGGTIKIVRGVTRLKDWHDLTLDRWLHMIRSELKTGKRRFVFGASCYTNSDSALKYVRTLGLQLKKHLRLVGLSPRFMMNTEGILSSVAVTKNGLVGRELVIAQGREQWFVGITDAVQDFDSYGLRDYGRPARNTERGMLPPKVAQIMLNLVHATPSDTLLDPFCGGGTVLQEALLTGMTNVWGSDNDAAAVKEATENAAWFSSSYNMPQPNLAVVDVYGIASKYPAHFFSIVVTEPYLGPGRLFKRRGITRRDIEAVVRDCNALYSQLFKELSSITTENAHIAIVLPIFRLLGDEYPVGKLELFASYGWELVKPRVHAYLNQPILSSRGQLVYSREDQVVIRELTVWRKKH